MANAWLAQLEFQKVLDEASVDETAEPPHQAEIKLLRARRISGSRTPKPARKLSTRHMCSIPIIPRVLVTLSGLALVEGDLDKAESLIERAREIAPEDPDVLIQAGAVTRARGDLVGVVAEYQASVRTNPDIPHFKLALAEAQIKSGDLEPAIEALDAYLKRYSQQPYANYLRGLAAYQKGDFEGANSTGN